MDRNDDNDYDENCVFIRVHRDPSKFEADLRHFEACGRRAAADIREVTLRGGIVPGETDDDDRRGMRIHRQRRRRCFSEFVTLLGRYGREGVREVTIYYIGFDDPDWGLDEADHARLFGEVLPSLPLLEKVRFTWCSISIAHLKTFASGMSATSSLRELDVSYCCDDQSELLPDIVGMIRRNVPIEVLELMPIQRMGKDAFRHICDCLRYSSTLRSLALFVTKVFDDAPILPCSGEPSSPLRYLRMHVEEWTEEGKASLARQMRTHPSLERVHVVHHNVIRLSHQPWIEMLETHNYSLRSLWEHDAFGPWGDTIQSDVTICAYLQRNERIHQALDQLHGYHVSPNVLLPSVLHLVSGLPTLLYRFVRLGNVNSLCELLLVRQRQQLLPPPPPRGLNGQAKRRSRPSPPPRRSARAARLRK
jgi:hypothetical protein